MKKNLICFLFSLSVFSQKSGLISYGVLLPDYRNNNEQSNELLIQAKEQAEKNTYVLEFNSTQSHFFMKNKMEEADGKNEFLNGIVFIIAGFSNYYDKVKGISINENMQGILLADKYPVKNWQVTSETKKIDNYLCYKAFYSENNKKAGKDRLKKVTAWFAPSLPYSYGPNSYNGLPGLVLELLDEETKKLYFVKSIELKDESIEIKFPKGKILTQEEYMSKANNFYR